MRHSLSVERAKKLSIWPPTLESAARTPRFGAYYGYWGYGLGAFSWDGWAPGYVATPTASTGTHVIDPESSVAGYDSTGIANLYLGFLQTKDGGGFASIEAYRQARGNLIRQGLQDAVAAIDTIVTTSLSFVPGAGGPLVLKDLEEGNKLGAVLGVLTLGGAGTVWGALSRGASSVALELTGDAGLLISEQALKRLNDLPASFKKPLFEALEQAPNDVDRLEIFRRFLFKNQGKIGKAGTLVRNDHLARKALGILDDPDYAAHHLITVAQAERSEALKAAAAVGYDINRFSNLIKLPNTERLSLAENVSR